MDTNRLSHIRQDVKDLVFGYAKQIKLKKKDIPNDIMKIVLLFYDNVYVFNTI